MPFLHLTSKRNQRDFPWVDALLADPPEPAWDQIAAAVASATGGPLYLTGGEPTLRRDLFEIVARLEGTFPERELVLLTNGRLFFYARMCDALATAKLEELAVEVVIASTRRDVHDELVGVTESFDQASKGIQNLVARGRRTRVRVLVGRHNIDHLHEIAAWIPDRFAGIERVVWDVATLAGAGDNLGVRPDEASSYLESAINLLRSRGMDLSIFGMPACAIADRFRGDLDGAVIGTFRDACAPCGARAECCGLLTALAADPAFTVHPIGSMTGAEAAAEYERYLMSVLARYVPESARGAGSVLDAMCGRRLRNLPVLRRFFRAAGSVDAADIDLDEASGGPPGTRIFRADMRQPLPADPRYAFIALLKPPDREVTRHALPNLIAALIPGGHMLIVLAEHTDVGDVLEALERLDAAVVTSEPNALRAAAEPEHKWVIVCRRESASAPSFDGAQRRL